jgi:hypothetical protein
VGDECEVMSWMGPLAGCDWAEESDVLEGGGGTDFVGDPPPS